MGLTAEQLVERKNYLGASDFPAILGLDPFRSALDVYIDKRGLAEEKPSAQPEKAKAGLRREPYLMAWLANEIGFEIIQPQFPCSHPVHGFIRANPDGVAQVPGFKNTPVELKLSGIMDGWGEDLSGDVPPKVLAQVAVQLACMPDAPYAHVVREFPDRYDWVAHRHVIQRDDEMIAAVIAAGVRFWTECVQPGVMPDPDTYPPMLESVKRLRRADHKRVGVDFAADIEPYLKAREVRLAAEKAEEALQARLLTKLGDAAVGECPEGEFQYLEESAGMRLDGKRLKEEFPVIYEQFAQEATRRVPRFKKAGAAKKETRKGPKALDRLA